MYVHFFFLTCTHKRGRGIRTSNLHFIRRDPSRLSYLLGTFIKFHNYMSIIVIFATKRTFLILLANIINFEKALMKYSYQTCNSFSIEVLLIKSSTFKSSISHHNSKNALSCSLKKHKFMEIDKHMRPRAWVYTPPVPHVD
jgi:hypothetical protein